MTIKSILASSFQTLKINPLLLELQRRCIAGGYIRAINYHGVSAETAGNFERQLSYYSARFSSVSLADLDRFFQLKRWDKKYPGLIISFDDGLSSNYSVAAPLLDQYGFNGWYFIPIDFVATPPSEQMRFACNHQILPDSTSSKAERVAMSWDELRDLDRRRHVIGCHTRRHLRMVPELPESVLDHEICTGKAVLEEELGHVCDCYAWVGGEEWSYTYDAARMIRKAGYKYSFTTNALPITRKNDPLQLGRNNVESDWPLSMASFELSGFQDLRYTPKRRRVARIIQTT
ncbi:MAG: polysaccharide deacetylase family protein [Terracidiphilus sp.]